MGLVDSSQTVLVLGAIVGGLLLGQASGVPAIADVLILPFLMVMLFCVFAGVPLSRLRGAVRNRRVVGSSLVVNFLWNPLLAVVLGAVFLRDHPALWVGLILLLVTPCTDWYLVFTDLADGDVALATSLLPYNLLIQLLLLPVYLFVLAGELVVVPLDLLAESILLVLVVPLLFAVAARRGFGRWQDRGWYEREVVSRLGPVGIVFLALAIGAMFASQGALLLDQPTLLALMAVPVAVFYAINLGIGFGVGRVLSFSYGELVCFNNTILSRNSPTALAIAVVAFPHEPLIPLALVIGPLLELPLLGVIARIHTGIADRGAWPIDVRPIGDP